MATVLPHKAPTSRAGQKFAGAGGIAAKYQSILETVGDTPVVRVNRLAPPGIDLFVKVEAFNPLGSVKDRLALGVIEAAEGSGDAVAMKLIDRLLAIPNAEAMKGSKDLAAKEGIFVGITSGGQFRGRAQDRERGPQRGRAFCACCRTPASAT